MPALHLLNQEGPDSPQPIQVSPGVMESGWWRISEERSRLMIGHPIHLHQRKAAPAFLSGVVTGFRREAYTTAKGNTSTRSVFLFTPEEGKHVVTDTAGWSFAGVKFIP